MADEKYITQEELTKTLSDFKTDLLESIKQMELEVKGSASPQLLKTVYNKWFHDTTKRVPDNLSKPFKQVSSTPYIWKIWDAMRALTCAVCDAKKVENITNPAMALDFCEKLCEFTYEYMIDCAKEKKKNMRIQRNIRIVAVPTKEEKDLIVGKEYAVEEIMMGQSNTSVTLSGIKGAFSSVGFTFMHDGKEIDIFGSALINPYIKYTGNNGICYKGGR